MTQTLKVKADIPLNPLPTNPEELSRCLADPIWRITSGCLYKIIVKGDDEEGEDGEATIMPFLPNRAQRRFIKRMWYKNIILKARQLGFTTLIAIMWLDHALFNDHQFCGIVAHTQKDAENIFRDKVIFAWQNLPPALYEQFQPETKNKSEIKFKHNGSSVRVAVSMRSGTIHRLHVSEMGKICAKNPERAQEIISGTLPTVPKNGIGVIESTAEGRSGFFFNKCETAKAMYQKKAPLNIKDYRFHFCAWFEEPKYSMPIGSVHLTDEDQAYFDGLLTQNGKSLSEEQKQWYVATLRADFANDRHTMMQEYPSTPDEAFSVSLEGKWYTKEIAAAYKQGRITRLPIDPRVPVNTFWDLGLSDNMALWLHQRVGVQDRFIGFFESSGEPPAYYWRWMQQWQNKHPYAVWGKHFLPHDGAKRNPGTHTLISYSEMFQELGMKDIEIVPRIDDVTRGITMVRDNFHSAWFDEDACATGIEHLKSYSKVWNTSLGIWTDRPLHDLHSNGADAFRQWGQGYKPDSGKKLSINRRGNWKTV